MCDFTYIKNNNIVIYSYIPCDEPNSHDMSEEYWYDSIKTLDYVEVGENNVFSLGDGSDINSTGIPCVCKAIILNGKIHEAVFISNYKTFLTYKRNIIINSIL